MLETNVMPSWPTLFVIIGAPSSYILPSPVALFTIFLSPAYMGIKHLTFPSFEFLILLELYEICHSKAFHCCHDEKFPFLILYFICLKHATVGQPSPVSHRAVGERFLRTSE